MFGVRKYDHFVLSFQEMILAIMELEPHLVILSYSDCATTKARRPFSNNCSMLSSATWCRNHVDKLYVGEGKPTLVKMFVGHDILAAAFNSFEFTQKAVDFDGVVRLCIVKASKVVESGYLLGSSKTMDDTNWSNHSNNHPRLFNVDVQVKSCSIPDPIRGLWNPKNQVHTAHILCSPKMIKLSTFKWLVCTTRHGKHLVQLRTFLKDRHSHMSLLN